MRSTLRDWRGIEANNRYGCHAYGCIDFTFYLFVRPYSKSCAPRRPYVGVRPSWSYTTHDGSVRRVRVIVPRASRPTRGVGPRRRGRLRDLRSVKQTQHGHGTDNNKYNRTELISINGQDGVRYDRVRRRGGTRTIIAVGVRTYASCTRVRRRSVYVIMYTIYPDVAHRAGRRRAKKENLQPVTCHYF